MKVTKAQHIKSNGQVSPDHLQEYDNSELLSLLKEKDQLISTVAHDLRSPLGSISALAMLLGQEGELSGGQIELLDLIKTATNYSLKLVDELLTSKKADLKNLYIKEIDVHATIRNYLKFSQHLIDSKGQHISVNFLDGDALLMIDKEKLTRVIDNLIGNAIKFTPRGGKIAISTLIIANGLQITVKDNGIGIPENIQPQIFSISGGGRSGTSGEKSHGLGLSICKRIIEEQGGSIHFQSRSGKGTNFYVWLPKLRSEPLSSSDPAAEDGHKFRLQA
ncbi:sensor histidine kinase [Mucilaginibacter myungsuensis]|uniref:histidine kinase n=1 Tax=Mucilaginibacter myungsuensis TaxID=649104 RepID=A0A929PWL4_9SPHI|nr:HAMP domain-containing sensor histidine kinase [Mucilaginibacter myungsuensis]MBE9662211.1 HAMP domain-containing histidine kinase [Mucilaginibacter myungsuensis]MDN3599355.1 HAMP domain-containing sensor histidine kinase [Mucilaginibacter myungsuensis]